MARIAGVDLPRGKRMEVASRMFTGSDAAPREDPRASGNFFRLKERRMNEDDVVKLRQIMDQGVKSKVICGAKLPRALSAISTWVLT